MRPGARRGKPIPGYGHPLHKERDPRVDALFERRREAGADLRFVAIAEAVEAADPAASSARTCKLNVSARDPGGAARRRLPGARRCKGVPILARTAGLIAHLYEEMQRADRLRAVVPGRRARWSTTAQPCPTASEQQR